MVSFKITSAVVVFALSAFVGHVQAAPMRIRLQKRIAQVIADSTQQWEKACIAAGGAQQCNPISVTAFTTLLAAAGPCEQQNSADAMVDLAKQLNSDADMIKFAQIFSQQPRNTPTSQSVPYCQQAPKNPELNGLFQCQFQSADKQTFVGGVKVGSPGTIPFGLNAPVSPPGSCPANPDGPIADGTQLVTITQNPGNVKGGTGTGNGVNNAGSGRGAGNNDTDTAPTPSATASSTSAASASSVSAAPVASAEPSSVGSASGFQFQNGEDAQEQNAKFASLTADSACNDGDQACIADGFAQCVNGKFVITKCAGGLTCAALPLVNKPGTSIACTTQADAQARIQATGAQGGIAGN